MAAVDWFAGEVAVPERANATVAHYGDVGVGGGVQEIGETGHDPGLGVGGLFPARTDSSG